MTQQYTPVTWQDETTSQQGTLINAERLNQMQTAHHYADGFEEVDAVPAADPGVSYHKIVYCTADSTFYRWDGTEWTKDIDDDTKRLLLEHEADHANPHQVTKAQVGLGNADNTSDQNKPVSTAQAAAIKLVQDYLDAHEANHSNPHQVTKAQVGLGNADNTSDADKPISTAAQTALDGKVSIIPVTTGVKFYAQTSGGTSLYQGTANAQTGITSVPLRDSSGRIKTETPSADTDCANKKYADDGLATKADKATTLAGYGITDAYTKSETDTLLASKADATQLTDGSVTKLGTADVGGDTKPIKLVAGVPTAVGHDLLTVDTVQNITVAKNYVSNMLRTKDMSQPAYTDPASNRQTIMCQVVGNDDVWGYRDEIWRYSAGGAIAQHRLRTDDGECEIKQTVKADGSALVTLPTPSAGAGSTEAVTVGYVSDTGGTLNNLVHTNGNETINGDKTRYGLDIHSVSQHDYYVSSEYLCMMQFSGRVQIFFEIYTYKGTGLGVLDTNMSTATETKGGITLFDPSEWWTNHATEAFILYNTTTSKYEVWFHTTTAVSIIVRAIRTYGTSRPFGYYDSINTTTATDPRTDTTKYPNPEVQIPIQVVTS